MNEQEQQERSAYRALVNGWTAEHEARLRMLRRGLVYYWIAFLSGAVAGGAAIWSFLT